MKRKNKNKNKNKSFKIINIINDNYEFKYNIYKNKNNIINPLIEIKRYLLFKEIKNHYYNILCKYILTTNIRKNTKTLNQLTNESLIRYIFLGIAYNKNTIDPLFSYNFENYIQIKKDIKNIIKYDKDDLILNSILNELNLKYHFNNSIKKIQNYIKNNTFEYLNFNITTYIKNNIEYEKISYGKYFIIINKFIKNKLKKLYINKYYDYNTFINHIWCLLFRYFIINDNNQLILNVHEELELFYKNTIELFASSINCYKNYCSIFYDIEHLFNSYGNFFNVTLIKGFYKANMPYDEEIMKLACKKLIYMLKKSDKPLACLLCMPVWDINGKKTLLNVNNNMEEYYGNYEALDILEKSNLITYKRIIPKKEINYLSINNMKKISASNTYIIVIENQYSNLDLEYISNVSYL